MGEYQRGPEPRWLEPQVRSPAPHLPSPSSFVFPSLPSLPVLPSHFFLSLPLSPWVSLKGQVALGH